MIPYLNHKIKVLHYADSQGRKARNEVMNKCNLNINSVVKPGAKFCDILPEKSEDLGKDDFMVIKAGSNDIIRKEMKDILVALRRTLGALYGTNVIVFSIPNDIYLPV